MTRLERNRPNVGAVDDVTPLLRDVAGKKVLEVGCSNGWRPAKLAAAGAGVYGLDREQEAVEEAHELGLHNGQARQCVVATPNQTRADALS